MGVVYGPHNEAEAAMACVDAADTAIRWVVQTAADDGRRWTRRFYKGYTTDTGPSAVVLMGLGRAAIDARMRTGQPEQGRQLDARRVLTATFGRDAESDRFLDELSEQINPETAEGLMEARVDLALAVIRSVMGADAASMPRFAALSGDDDFAQYSAGLAWQICFNHATTAWLYATDPDRVLADRKRVLVTEPDGREHCWCSRRGATRSVNSTAAAKAGRAPDP